MASFDIKKFKKIQNRPHSAQAIWFLNGFWGEPFDDETAEEVWKYAHKFYEIQMGRRKYYGATSKNNPKEDSKEGKSLDQFQAHRFLESVGETKTASALRAELKTIDVDKNNKMSITEYLLFKYGKTPQDVIDAPQGNPEEIREAQAALQEAHAQLNELSSKLSASQDAASEARRQAAASEKAAEEAAAAHKAAVKNHNQAGLDAAAARAALNASNTAASEAAVALADQETADALCRSAEAAVKASVDRLHAEQKKLDDAIAKATATANDSSKGVVRRNRAKNEIEQLKANDPLPLSRAKITQASALKKAQKQSKKAAKATKKAADKKEVADNKAAESAAAAKAAQESHIAAETAAAEAETAKHHADLAHEEAKVARQNAEDAAAELAIAFNNCEAKMAECAAVLEALKKKGGVGKGKLFWMAREMKEIRKYMPRR